ncbi:YjbQ family protein [Acidithiobacillus ferrooxidans]|nr:YjbQ family protein [Acidithiobacillus ferrooxidans]
MIIPVREGRAGLGGWQGVFLFEHRVRPVSRRVLVSFQGVAKEV